MNSGNDPLNKDDNPDSGSTEIHHAAELVIFTQEGKTYQIQMVKELGTAGWTDVGDPIPGTGAMVEHLISTREENEFYRVVEVEAQP